jgi:hypothetical protein
MSSSSMSAGLTEMKTNFSCKKTACEQAIS